MKNVTKLFLLLVISAVSMSLNSMDMGMAMGMDMGMDTDMGMGGMDRFAALNARLQMINKQEAQMRAKLVRLMKAENFVKKQLLKTLMGGMDAMNAMNMQ